MEAEVQSEAVRRAFRAALLIRRSGAPVAVVILVLAGIGFAIHAALGMLVITISMLCMVCAFTILAVRARCPHCNAKWWDNSLLAATTGKRLRSMLDPDCTGNETDELKCRHCGLEIGSHLTERKPNPLNGTAYRRPLVEAFRRAQRPTEQVRFTTFRLAVRRLRLLPSRRRW